MKRLLLVILTLGCILLAGLEALAVDRGDLDRALSFYNRGKFREAERYLREYVEQRPDPKGYYLLGYALYKQKRFVEAEEQFRQAYLIDPTFSPEKNGLPERPGRKKYRKPKVEAEAVGTAGQMPNAVAPQPPKGEMKAEPPTAKPEPLPPAQPQQPPAAQKPPAPPAPSVAAPRQTPSPQPAPAPPAPQQAVPTMPPAMKQPVPMPMPGMGTGLVTGLLAGFATIFLLIGLAVYLFSAYCIYRIAVKLNVPAAWTAWVPLLQLWATVSSAGKPWWWLLLLLVPLVNFFIIIYLWMCIAENLGQNRWLGLLILLPVVNLIFVAFLALSKSAQPVSAAQPLGEG